MELEKLLLKKEELPILHGHCFQIPIHPKLLDPKIRIDETIASRIFPNAAKEWHEDLKKYIETMTDNQEKEWFIQAFLNKGYQIKKECESQSLAGGWSDEILTAENGFARVLSISRNGGGTLGFDKDDHNCRSFIPFKNARGYIQFNEEKIKEFNFEKSSNNNEGSFIYVYSAHNVDYYPGALFLRNWAILYMNEVFKRVF